MFGRIIIGQRDVIVACKLITGSTIADPAVDVEASNLEEYERSLYDRKCLTLRPGQEPTVISIKPLTVEQRETATGFDNYRSKAKWYWRCGVKGLRNYVVEDEAGNAQVVPVPDGDGVKPSSEEWFAKVDPPEQYLIAVYKMIERISEAELPLLSNSATPAGQQSSAKTATE